MSSFLLTQIVSANKNTEVFIYSRLFSVDASYLRPLTCFEVEKNIVIYLNVKIMFNKYMLYVGILLSLGFGGYLIISVKAESKV